MKDHGDPVARPTHFLIEYLRRHKNKITSHYHDRYSSYGLRYNNIIAGAKTGEKKSLGVLIENLPPPKTQIGWGLRG